MAHSFELKTGGRDLQQAEKVLIMIHGRGGSADDILSLAAYLQVDDYAILAPQATQHTWYPHSFMAPVPSNQPWLDSALDAVDQTVQTALEAGIPTENIYFFGFSQGACLVLEYLARYARPFGGAAALIGGLIGQEIDQTPYRGEFGQTPILLATSNPDFHVPVQRVQESASILSQMNAAVTTEIYENAGHTIHQAQLDLANKVVFGVSEKE